MAPLRWQHAPPDSHWGEFGPDDQLGRMNLITPTQVRLAVAEVREGRSFCLSLPLDLSTGHPRRQTPQRYAITRDGASAGQQGFCWAYANDDPDLTDVVNDDTVVMALQASTQWDSLAHMGSLFDADGDGVPEMVFYNGFRAGVDIHPAPTDPEAPSPHQRFPNPVAGALGIEHLARHGVQGRGVLIDLDHHLGRARQAVGYDTLMRLLDSDGISIAEGDLVCLHTGYAHTLLAMAGQPDLATLHQAGGGLDGRDTRLLNWITDVRLAALIADNPAVEHIGPKLLAPTPLRQAKLPLHEHCLFKNGIHLGELWWLTDLARWLRAASRHHFFLTAPPLRLTGAVGSPVTPIATV